MRRTLLSAQSARAVSRVFSNGQPRRTFAAPAKPNHGTEQAHPVGAFYEAVLRTPSGAIPKVKPEEPPVTSQESEKPAPKTTAEKPAASESNKPKPTAQDVPKVEEKPATPEEKPTEKTHEKPSKPASPPKSSTTNTSEGTAAHGASNGNGDGNGDGNGKYASRKRKPKMTDSKAKSVSPSSSYSSPASSHPTSSSSSSLLEPSSSSDIDDDVPPSSSSSGSEPTLSSSSKESNTSDYSSQAEQRARVIFGSSLAGPAERAERLARIKNESRLIAGVLVPPKPDEPDNCCMSGCVNCVWDRYRDEMEEYVAKAKEADARVAAMEAGGARVSATEESAEAVGKKTNLGVHEIDPRGAVSMDDDGGGSASNWDVAVSGKDTTISKNLWDDDLYKNVPVGIREFMKQEKRLKEKHSREGTLGG